MCSRFLDNLIHALRQKLIDNEKCQFAFSGLYLFCQRGGFAINLVQTNENSAIKLSMLVITDMNDSGSRQRISLGEAFVANTLQIVSKTRGAPLYV